jgi:hypothetical protein
MRTEQYMWDGHTWKNKEGARPDPSFAPDLTLIFGQRTILENGDHYRNYSSDFASGQIVIGTTSGNIMGLSVSDDDLVATAIKFDKSSIETRLFHTGVGDSIKMGRAIGEHFSSRASELKLIYIVSDGQMVNGSDLVIGIADVLGSQIPVAGGLAGDDARFETTLVGLNAQPGPGNIVVIGFYGEELEVGCGTRTGWEPFGPERQVTRADKNVLYEIDGKSALALYKSYLGERASELPGSALLFPLEITLPGTNERMIRTILAVNEDDQSMTFAGNLPEGSTVQLMKANFDKLIDGAADAAGISKAGFTKTPELALLVSCVGRKLILGQRTEEEIEEASSVLGTQTTIAGFYSYGEIAPYGTGDICQLHNQSMTITSLREK